MSITKLNQMKVEITKLLKEYTHEDDGAVSQYELLVDGKSSILQIDQYDTLVLINEAVRPFVARLSMEEGNPNCVGSLDLFKGRNRDTWRGLNEYFGAGACKTYPVGDPSFYFTNEFEAAAWKAIGKFRKDNNLTKL